MSKKTVTVDRHAAFIRVGQRHVTAAIKAIKRIENLAQPRYSHTPEEIDLIDRVLSEAVAEMKTAFEPKKGNLTFKF